MLRKLKTRITWYSLQRFCLTVINIDNIKKNILLMVTEEILDLWVCNLKMGLPIFSFPWWSFFLPQLVKCSSFVLLNTWEQISLFPHGWNGTFILWSFMNATEGPWRQIWFSIFVNSTFYQTGSNSLSIHQFANPVGSAFKISFPSVFSQPLKKYRQQQTELPCLEGCSRWVAQEVGSRDDSLLPPVSHGFRNSTAPSFSTAEIRAEI